jgi:hypothetical protein
MADKPRKVIHLTIEINVSMTAAEYWGDPKQVPDEINADTVLANLQGLGGLRQIIRDWDLDRGLHLDIGFPGGSIEVDEDCDEISRYSAPKPATTAP